ncbi:hypothetical protein H8D36_07055 [archaeon]|nr:hypothetical protein [archaeon]
MEKHSKNIHPLMKKSELKDDHAMFDLGVLEKNDSELELQIPQHNQPNMNSVWPVDSNIIIEHAELQDKGLNVTLTNLSVDPIKIISAGVKYSSDNSESIEFQQTNITIPSGECCIDIPCPRGKPFKFVIRTANGTGAGNTLDNMNW